MMVKPFTIIMKLMTVGSRTRQNPTGFPWGFFVAAVGGVWGCKIAEDRKTILFFLLLPIFCNLCHFSICRAKTIQQRPIYQEPFGVVGQRGVARHPRRGCLAQSATFKQIYDRARGCLNQEKRNIIIGLYPQMC